MPGWGQTTSHPEPCGDAGTGALAADGDWLQKYQSFMNPPYPRRGAEGLRDTTDAGD